MTAGERFRTWIKSTAEGFAEQLRGWMSSWLAWGVELLMDIIAKAAAPKLKPFIDTLEKSGEVPPELQPILDELKSPTGQVAAMFANSAGGALIGGALGKLTDALFNPLAYWVGDFKQNALLSEAHYIAYWLRGRLTPEQLDWYLHRLNLSDAQIAILRELSTVRLDPLTAIRANWRGIIPDDTLKRLLNDQGIRDADIATLREVSKFYPAPADLIRWQAREVFEPEMIARYGLDDEFGAIEKEPFYKAGMTDEQILNFWRAHWEHASWMQVVEMLHRGLLTEEQVWDWFRVVEIPPFWRQKLIDTAYTWPTRVDVRRWWDMRTIDETELRRLYSGMGYRGVNLDNYVLWTKVYVAFPDLMARWSKGWITIDDVRRELTELGMPAERLEEMIQMKIKPQEPERVEEGKTLTKTEIYKGVKKELITWGEGIELLMDLGYDEDEADYILAINVAVEAGSPETFAEFKDLTQKYRRAAGLVGVEMPEEIKKAAAEVVRLTGEVSALILSIEEEKRGLVGEEVLPEAATKRLKTLQVKRNRAISTLEKAKSDYDRLVAEWKH